MSYDLSNELNPDGSIDYGASIEKGASIPFRFLGNVFGAGTSAVARSTVQGVGEGLGRDKYLKDPRFVIGGALLLVLLIKR